MNIKALLILLLSVLTFSSCTTDIDDEIRISSATEISDFVYRGLNFWSLYKGDVPALANDAFASDGERREFLEQFATPEDAFEALKSQRDRFSILRSDYIELENALAGIRTSTGMRFSIVEDPNSNNLFGVVRYVINNSPAATAGVERGMLFTAVDGVALTDNSDLNAIFGADAYTINLADYDGTNFTLNGNDIPLTQAQLNINPVHKVSVTEVQGKTIGYLHYTGFTNEFDTQLNEAFGTFKASGVTDLILDLRYNGGGSIETANDLCTMITGQFEGQEFITQEYNEDRNPDNEFTRRFNNNLGSGNDGPAINSLNLNEVQVITTGNTASASELILSGLRPYISINQIGTTTEGKFEGSFLLYDAPAPNFRRSDANLGHRYVMLPLVLKSINADGFTDYFNGIAPNTEISENAFNLGVLGETSDPLTQAAYDAILGRRSSIDLDFPRLNSAYESDENDLLYQRMIVD
ncbi:S41 family peptidase [Dokdonia sinensis]|nr:S41 family peptidase [Dokdonia sinensis]